MSSQGPEITDSNEIGIRLSGLPTYEAGAVLFTYLAFPESGDEAEEQRAWAHAALCHLALQAIAAEDEAASWAPQVVKPAYPLLTESECQAALRTYEGRYHDRLRAAIIAKPFIEKALNGAPPRLPPGVTKLTLTALAEWRDKLDKPDSEAPDPKNFLTRVWRPSLPVLPAALGLNIVYTHLRRGGLATLPPVYQLLRSPEILKCIVETAQALEATVLSIPKFQIPPERLLRFRLT
ncbi:hypothetical protein [Acidocella aromatica]|uniref:Uncharacterized protein n=1 Tax=Acidocella aromatica TaxID=1303579 RepID=A0A840VFL2_9PROT|nr:hypothetical protein [Acidocella aromatica]MBB5374486.1 hypothetical protein [Acidocella aromatica]